jgi:spore coat polysaccharide biosynthesis protein SpsF (cytidylyltransferase family)
MLPTGRTVLREVMYRCRQIVGVDKFVVAVPYPGDCDFLIRHVQSSGLGFSVAVGPEDDVLTRYAMAAQMVDADHVMRITADCPCLNPMVCARVLKLHLDGGFDYTANCWPRTYPQGYDCEVFTRRVLDAANRKSTHRICREHVTPYFNGSFPDERMSNIRCGNLSQDVDESHIRLTLDTVSDYDTICHHLMGNGYGTH